MDAADFAENLRLSFTIFYPCSGFSLTIMNMRRVGRTSDSRRGHQPWGRQFDGVSDGPISEMDVRGDRGGRGGHGFAGIVGGLFPGKDGDLYRRYRAGRW